nr:hypothetical protein [Tanacetum cinerariifolium]
MTLNHRRSLLLIIISLSFQSAHSKSDTSSSSSSLAEEWQILTKHNFSSQIRLNPYLILFVTVPWSGESRSLMKELVIVTRKKEEFRTLKLMVVHKNLEKMLADGLGATGDINVICYRHSLPYKYQGALRVQNILSSVRYLMSLLPEEIPLKSLPTAEDLTTFLESTDKALLVLEFCGWTPKLTAKLMTNGSENAFGVPGKGLFGKSDDTSSAVRKKNQGMMENGKITCDVDDQFSGNFGLGEFAPLNESDFLEAEKLSSSNGASCSFEEFQLFESSLYNFTTTVREFFLPPERLKFGHVSERSLFSSLGIGDTGSWSMVLYTTGCPSCAKVFRRGSDLKRIIKIDASPVMELKGDEYGFDPGLPSDRPSALLFIDRSSDSLKISRKSKESLTVFRELASHNHIPFKKKAQNVVKPQKPFMEGHASRTVHRHPKLELSTSSQKVTVLEDKITIMAFEDGKQITINDVASNLQGNSLQEVLEYVLQHKKQRKLSSLAKDVGFQLLSDDIDITMSETAVQSDAKMAELPKKDLMGSSADFKKDQVSDVSDDEKIPIDQSAQFFFVDGQFRLLETLTSALKIPSLVIIDPISHQHYVYPTEADFSNSSLSGFLHMFLNGSLLPYERSKSIIIDSKETPHPPFVNQDFHEADPIPRVSAPTFMELVVGNHSGSVSAENAWKKDVLVLFTSSWCGFCLRTELVVREIYRAFKGYDNIVRGQSRNEQSLKRNDGLNNTTLKLPIIYMMDCTENDCRSLLKSSTKRDIYPSLLLYPSERKESISYDGEISVSSIIKFIADQGGDSQWLYKERGKLWSEAEHGVDDKSYKNASEHVIHSDVSLSKESNEIQLEGRTQTHTLGIKDKTELHIPYDSSESRHEILPGSILVATEKLLHVYPFAKSKILVVKVNHSTEFQGGHGAVGWYGGCVVVLVSPCSGLSSLCSCWPVMGSKELAHDLIKYENVKELENKGVFGLRWCLYRRIEWCGVLLSRDIYPSLLLYPSERKESISYDGEISVSSIIKFIADQGGDSQWLYKERENDIWQIFSEEQRV